VIKGFISLTGGGEEDIQIGLQLFLPNKLI
jgi:hypothetical protein